MAVVDIVRGDALSEECDAGLNGLLVRMCIYVPERLVKALPVLTCRHADV